MSKAVSKAIEKKHSKWGDLKMLVKLNLTNMVVMSSVFAYLVAAGLAFDWVTLLLLTLGGYAVTGAANGINQVLEREFDSMMERTKTRPLAAGRMSTSEAVLISGLLLVAGMIFLGMIHPLCAFIGMLSFVLYAFLYTPMKRYSTISVALGAIPGALPVLIGAIAHEGTITILGIVLFLIQFLWQFPHFWAIAYLSFSDYDKAGYKLLPKSKDGNIDTNLGLYSTIYSMLIIPTVIWAYISGMHSSLFVLIGVILITLFYSWMGMRLQMNPSRKTARGLMFSSFAYLPLVLVLYMIG